MLLKYNNLALFELVHFPEDFIPINTEFHIRTSTIVVCIIYVQQVATVVWNLNVNKSRKSQHRYKVLLKPNAADASPPPPRLHLWSLHAAASERLLLPLLYADFILCVIFVRTPRHPPHSFFTRLTLETARGLYLADDLLRAHSLEVSACRGGLNDVGGTFADSLRVAARPGAGSVAHFHPNNASNRTLSL